MDGMLMLRTAVALFAIAAVGGLVMAGIRMTTKANPPAALAMLHGLLAAAALTLVAFATFTSSVPRTAQMALVLLLGAAAGGAFLNLGYQWKQRLLPMALVFGHAGLAVVGFGFLAVAAYG